MLSISGTKSKGNALSCEEFNDFIKKNELCDVYIAGADAVACVKSTCYNLRKENYGVTVLSDCVTSYYKRKVEEMLKYMKVMDVGLLGWRGCLNSPDNPGFLHSLRNGYSGIAVSAVFLLAPSCLI
jgi:hypothetical protein